MKMNSGAEQPVKPCAQPDLADLFPLYINGNLAPEALARIDEHLAECSLCRSNVRLFLDLQST